MHISEEDLRNLSEAYVKEERLNDRQLELKKHMADCDRCYEIFCAQYVLQKQLSAHGLLPPESEKRVVFALKAAAGIYEMIQQKKETFHSNWEFVRLPMPAASRSGGKKMQTETFISRKGEYSFIECSQTQVVIQFDAEEFSAGAFVVRVQTDHGEKTYDFVYHADKDCYQVILNTEEFHGETVIEIIEDADGN